MTKLTRGILVATAAALVASVFAPQPASAAPATRSSGCYAQGWETDRASRPVGGMFRTHTINVTEQSPCKDINVRGATTAAGQPMCRTVRVRWTYGFLAPGDWTRVCGRPVVAFYNAPEALTFTLEVRGEPANLQFRT